MKKNEYASPVMTVSEYAPTMVFAMSWSNEETDEALTNERSDNNCYDWEEDFWSSRE
ncbi:MAG: hypothetical protein IKH26_10815 [Bacteroidaceae bacterium]|nr:hypothetical protein [Bacteroidaceae bacterium]